MKYRDYVRQEFKGIADEGFVRQIKGLDQDRRYLGKIISMQPNKADKEALKKALKLYDDFSSYIEELDEENIDADDKWLFCYILDIILMRIEEYFDVREQKNQIERFFI